MKDQLKIGDLVSPISDDSVSIFKDKKVQFISKNTVGIITGLPVGDEVNGRSIYQKTNYTVLWFGEPLNPFIPDGSHWVYAENVCLARKSWNREDG